MKVASAVPIGTQSARQEFAISVLPSVASNGRINVSGSLDYTSSDDSLSSKEFSITVDPDKPHKLPRITVPSGKGKETQTLEVTVTASLPDKTEHK